MTLRPLAFVVLTFAACGLDRPPEQVRTPPPDPSLDPQHQAIPPRSTISRFESLAQLEAYFPAPNYIPGAGGSGGWSGVQDAGVASGSGGGSGTGGGSGSTPGNMTITNNQELGVDEGDIVKNIGDHLIILRKGRLYAAQVVQAGAPVQTGSIRVAPTAQLNTAVWYDEMLVKGREIYVIGYRYVASFPAPANVWGATELGRFRLETDGSLSRGETKFIESDDYYSGRNYASRLIGNQLVLYSSFSASRPWAWTSNRWVPGPLKIPSRLEFRHGAFVRVGELFAPTDVYRPVTPPKYGASYYAVIRCDLELNCVTQPLLGGWSNAHYVTSSDFFLLTDNLVYRLELASGGASVHAIRGSPIDQFSFQAAGGQLHVLTRSYQSGGATLERLSLPLSDFDAVGSQPLAGLSHPVSSPSNQWLIHNRFVGGELIAAFANGWYGTGQASTTLVVHSLATGANTPLSLPGRSSRLEPMPGLGALAVTEANDLTLTTVTLGASPALGSSLVLTGVSEAESRSHAFFFKPSATGGTFGLTFQAAYSGYGWWGSGVSNLAFFDATPSHLSLIGSVSSTVAAGGTCETSCVDWYGNTRPIFLGAQAFALMGSELQELTLGATVTSKGTRLVLKP